MSPAQFRRIVWAHSRLHGRHGLPWRTTHNPYRILVSEVMLQQTQVERVIPYYRRFLRAYPSVRALANAPLGDVLRAWQGLGYNRRAKMLHEAAKTVVRSHGGKMPSDTATLATLPGVGPYTASAVAAFASNEDGILIETNIRTVITHHFFSESMAPVSDTQVREILQTVYPKGRAREWYAALMDYGAYLKRSGIRINQRAKGYAKQKTFEGSLRQARGAILKALIQGAQTEHTLLRLLPEREEQLRESLKKLVAEGMLLKQGRRYRLP